MVVVISIILPVYNRSKTLGRAIQSVLKQSFTDWELIAVDDCSTDDSMGVLRLFQNQKIKVYQTTKNSGAAVARNLGIRNSCGHFISFLDSDDEYEPNFLASSIEMFRMLPSDTGLIWTGMRYFRKERGYLIERENTWKPDVNDPYRLFLSDLRIGTNSGITIRRQVFNKVGFFDEGLPAAEDTDLFLRISVSYGVNYIDKILINIHQTGEDRLSKRFDKIAIAYNQIIPKHLDVINTDKKLRLKYFYKAMWLNYHLGDREVGRYYFKQVLRDNFASVQAWLIMFLFEFFGRSIGSRLHISISERTK